MGKLSRNKKHSEKMARKHGTVVPIALRSTKRSKS